MFVLLTGRVTEHAGMHSGKYLKPLDCTVKLWFVPDAPYLLARKQRFETAILDQSAPIFQGVPPAHQLESHHV